MIKLRFEPNDITDKYEVKLNHTEICVETNDGEKITEEQVLKIMPFIHVLVNDAVDYLTIKIIYNKTGCNDELCPKDIREKIVKLFAREKTVLTTNFFEAIKHANDDFYHFIFHLKFCELEEEYLKLLDIQAHVDRDKDLAVGLYSYPYDKDEIEYMTDMRYKSDYKLGEEDYYYESIGKRRDKIKFKI